MSRGFQTFAALVAGVLTLAGCSDSSIANALGDDPSFLTVPTGFVAAYASKHVPGARFLAIAPNGDVLVSETNAGEVVVIPHGASSDASPTVFASGLSYPHGLAFYKGDLYVATWAGVLRYGYPSRAPATLFSNLPEGGDHNRRALAISADGTIFVSSGSDCNVCDESDPRFATVLRYLPGDATGSIYASGLRNASGLAFDASGRLWAVVNQRDNIGPSRKVTDDLPPDELDLVRPGENYGWPQCYPSPFGPSRLPNPEYPGANCSGQTPAELNLAAHSAPLGIAFYYGNQFPASYRGDAFVAFHGSWNRSTPTGDKVVLVKFSGGKPAGYSDFITGWLNHGSYRGRPAGVAIGPDGSLYVSDDLLGCIYRITYAGRT